MGRDTGTVEEETNGETEKVVTRIVTENEVIMAKLDLIIQSLQKEETKEDSE